MAKIPDALAKREYVFGRKGTPQELRTMAGACLERGWVSDAVDLLARAGDEERLRELVPMAVQEGDVFLLQKITRLLHREPTDEEWAAVGFKAEELGKLRFACTAYEAVKDGSSLSRVQARLGMAPAPAPEPAKA
jgi:hypothetical protein